MADGTRAAQRAIGWVWRLSVVGGLLGLVGVVGASPAGASPCEQATISWDGGAGTTAWSTGANWTGDRLPNADDHVCIPAGSPGASVTLSGTASVKSLQAAKPFTHAGTLTLTSTAVSSSVTSGAFSGSLNGPGELRITGTVDWTMGEMKGLSTVEVAPGGRLNVTAGSSRTMGSEATIVNNGTVSFGGRYSINLGENFRIHNNAMFEFTPGTYGALRSTAAATAVKPLIVNTGTIVKTTAGDKPIEVPLWNKSGGVVRSDLGNLLLYSGSGGNPASGIFAGGVWLYGTHPLSDATFTGIGNKLMGAHALPGGTTTTIASGSTMLAGNVDGPGKLLVQATLDWTKGEMKSSATAEVAPGARLNVLGSCCTPWSAGSNATIVNNGTLVVGGGDGVTVGENFQIRNNATFEFSPGSNTIISDISAATAVKPLITNTGTIVKTTAGDRPISVPLWNKSGGVVRSDLGNLLLYSGSGGNPASGIFAGGVWLYGTHPLSDATFTGIGNKLMGAHALPEGTTTTIAPGSVTILDGNIEGPGKLLVRGTLEWSRGEMRSSASTYVAAEGRLNVTPQSCCTNRPLGSNAKIVNDGTMAIAAGEGLAVGDAFEIYNNGRLEWTPSDLGDISDASTTTKPLISNAGTFVKQGAHRGQVRVPMENDGTIEVEAGALLLDGRFRSFSKTRGILKEGDYVLKGALRVASMSGQSVTRNAARITLDGPAAAITDHTSADALRGLTRNAGGGRLTLRNGATLATLGSVRNAGKVTVEAGSTLTTAGYTQDRGTTVVEANGTLAVGSSPGLNLLAGSLRGSGLVQGNVTNSGGTLMPGAPASPGRLTVQGQYTQASTASLDLDVAGPTSHDVLAVTGLATLDGRLNLLTSPAYAPAVGDVFTLLTYASHTGAFAPFSSIGLPVGLAYSLELHPQSTTAVVQ